MLNNTGVIEEIGLKLSLLIYTNILKFSLFRVKVTFIRASGERIEAKGKVGDTLLDIVVNNDIDLDGFGNYHVQYYFANSHFGTSI